MEDGGRLFSSFCWQVVLYTTTGFPSSKTIEDFKFRFPYTVTPANSGVGSSISTNLTCTQYWLKPVEFLAMFIALLFGLPPRVGQK